MAISLRLSKEDETLFKNFAQANNMTVSALVRESVLRRIEDEYDLNTYKTSLEKFAQDNETIDFDQLIKEKHGL